MNLLADPGAYGQALPGSRAVTFAVTHDIPTNDGFRYRILNQTDESLAYAYLLGREVARHWSTPIMAKPETRMACAGRNTTCAPISRE